MTDTLLKSILRNPSTILLLDGGTSTCLENILQAKPEPQSFPDRNLWSSSLLLSASGRKDIQNAHDQFYDAGSDIVTTVTYQLSHFATRHGYDDETVDGLLLAAVDIARQSSASSYHKTKKKRYVVASLGCFGAVLADGSEYTGDYGSEMPIEELINFHKRRVQTLLSSESRGLAGLAFETIPCLKEVKAIVEMIKSLQEHHSGVFSWLSLACKDEKTLNDGTPLSDVLHTLNEMDPHGILVQGIGVNCCNVKFIHELSQNIAKDVIASKCRRTVVLYPNSGEIWVADTETWLEGSGVSSEDDYAREMLKCIRGIHALCDELKVPRLSVLVGGCCRTTPSMIKALRNSVDKYTSGL